MIEREEDYGREEEEKKEKEKEEEEKKEKETEEEEKKEKEKEEEECNPPRDGRKAMIDHSYVLNIILNDFLLFSIHSSCWMQDAKSEQNIWALKYMF